MADDACINFEVCAETLGACAAASAGGADRIELCRSLHVGGLTPDLALVQAAVQQSSIPVHVLLRPHANGFVGSPGTVAAIASSLASVRAAGAAGVVFGLLRKDGTVDVAGTQALVRLASPLPVTFHRAFDETPNLALALEEVIATGCTRLLTSGGAPDVVAGTPMLARLIRQAGDRIDIVAGGGLRLENARAVARDTGGRSFHGSLRRNLKVGPSAETVRRMVDVLREGAKRAKGVGLLL